MFIKKLIEIIVSMVGLIKGKAKFSDIIMQLMAKLPEAVLKAIEYGHIDSVAKLDDALAALDAYTGIEPGALDIIKDLPADKEEELFKALGKMVEILAKNKMKVPGYYVEV